MRAEFVDSAQQHNIEDLLTALRARKAEFNVSFEVLDDLSGLGERFSIKLIGPKPNKTLGSVSLGATLRALAVRLVVEEDPAQLARIQSRLVKRNEAQVRHRKPR